MHKLIALALLAPLLVACSNIQKVEPAAVQAGEKLCLINNPNVHQAFADSYIKALTAKGLEVEVVPFNTGVDGCPLMATYTANWRWSWALYLRFAHLAIFRDGKLEGMADYNARSWGPNRYIKAADKVDELVGLMLPAP